MSILAYGSRRQAAAVHPQSPVLVQVAGDARADGALRRVSIEGRRVIIERRVGGIAMRIGVAAAAYRGVALSLAAARGGATAYRVSLVHRDPDLDVELYAACHDREIFAEWRGWATYFALPKLVEREPGRYEPAAAQLVASAAVPPPRRRGAALSKRGSRIRLRRRKPARRPLRVIRGESEIACYE